MTSASFPIRRDDGAPAGPNGNAGGPRLRDALPPGTLLGGGYRIERTLGQGGFGIVYLAIDLALQRPVAIKEFLPVHLALRGEGQQITLREAMHRDAFSRGLTSFLREARLLAQFDHPSLVRVYRFWEENQTAYMAMPYYEGPTLAAARQAMLRPPEEGWLRDQLLLPLIGALETLHDGHCLHRDVSPGNILLLPDGRPLLLDFGSARRVVGDMTQPLTAIVNPAYAAIEQYAESPNLPQGPWTDVYGLACVAYYVLSGRAPAPATVRAVNDSALMPMAEVGQLISKSFPNLHYSPAFLAALDRALALRPNERPQSAPALREALVSPHVQPDVAIEDARRPAAPPPVDEIRLPADPANDGEAASAAPEAAGDDDEQAIRATIHTALGEIADWPTIAPVRRGQSVRIEPELGPAGARAGTDSASQADTATRRGVPPAKPVHLAVVAGSEVASAPAATAPSTAAGAPADEGVGRSAPATEPWAPRAEPVFGPTADPAQVDPALAAVPGDDASRRRPGARPRGSEPAARQEPRWEPQPMPPVTPAQAVPPVQPMQPVPPAQPMEPMQPVQSMQTARPAQPAELPQPVDEQRPGIASSDRVAPGASLPPPNPPMPAIPAEPPRDAYAQTRPEARITRAVTPERPLPPAAAQAPAGTPLPSRPEPAATMPMSPVEAGASAGRATPDERRPDAATASAIPPDTREQRVEPEVRPPLAEVVPLDRFTATGTAAAGAADEPMQSDTWERRPRRGGAWAAAAVIAAALVGGGLWYAQDLNPGVLAWLGLPSHNETVAAGDQAPPATSPGAATPTAATHAGTAPTAAAQPGVQLAQQASPRSGAAGSRLDTTAGSGTGGVSGTTDQSTDDSAPSASPGDNAAAATLSAATAAPVAGTGGEADAPTAPNADGGNASGVAGAGAAKAAPPATAQADASPAPTPTRSATRSAATRSSTSTTRSASRKPSAPPHAVAQAKPSYPPTARAACGDRHNFALYYCMKAQCRLSRYSNSTECIRLREDDDVE